MTGPRLLKSDDENCRAVRAEKIDALVAEGAEIVEFLRPFHRIYPFSQAYAAALPEGHAGTHSEYDIIISYANSTDPDGFAWVLTWTLIDAASARETDFWPENGNG